jgi:negative regulator of sigma-B (phosphoserine phosphatase)
VISLASFDARDDVMTWLGVGNVEGVLLRADAGRNGVREVLVAPGGVVGYQMPTLRPAAYPVFRDDVLMFATDGIHRGYARQPAANRRLQEVADHALLHHSKGTDDALILVARYVGGL